MQQSSAFFRAYNDWHSGLRVLMMFMNNGQYWKRVEGKKRNLKKNVLETSDDGLRLYERKIYLHSKIADFLLFGEMKKKKKEQRNLFCTKKKCSFESTTFQIFYAFFKKSFLLEK